jgi:hypothetical protein
LKFSARPNKIFKRWLLSFKSMSRTTLHSQLITIF